MMMMIEIKSVSLDYGVKDLDLTVKKGEFLLLCGRSGCGKTTVTRLVNGLIPEFYPAEMTGDVFVDGKNVRDMPMYQIAERVGSVFQNPRTQFFNVDTDSEIAFGIENEAIPPEELHARVEQTGRELHIEKLRGRNIFELSGGEKQKIAFASVYAMNPDIYLLDEPSSNLDVDTIGELKQHLSLIKAQGKTVLVAEHRLYYLMDLADRIVYLEKGRIAGIYSPDEFRKIPDETRKKMGLRAIDLAKEVPMCPPCADSTKKGEPVLEIRDVSVFRKKQPVLSRISFAASQGEVIAVVGHNGTGKTTFSRALCGLHKECDGTFFWRGEPQNAKKRLGLSYMVMQDVNYELFAESVEAECSFGIKDPDTSLVEQTMKELGIDKLKRRHPNTLSGGQKQRVAVAVSMICKKELLVFDEPTSGLDYDSMVQVAGLIGALAASGKIVFVVTHDYEFVCRTCTRVLHLDHGKLLDDLAVKTDNLKKIQELFSVLMEERKRE